MFGKSHNTEWLSDASLEQNNPEAVKKNRDNGVWAFQDGRIISLTNASSEDLSKVKAFLTKYYRHYTDPVYKQIREDVTELLCQRANTAAPKREKDTYLKEEEMMAKFLESNSIKDLGESDRCYKSGHDYRRGTSMKLGLAKAKFQKYGVEDVGCLDMFFKIKPQDTLNVIGTTVEIGSNNVEIADIVYQRSGAREYVYYVSTDHMLYGELQIKNSIEREKLKSEFMYVEITAQGTSVVIKVRTKKEDEAIKIATDEVSFDYDIDIADMEARIVDKPCDWND